MSDSIIAQCMDVIRTRLNWLKTDNGQNFVVAELLSDRSQIRSYPSLVLIRGDMRTAAEPSYPSGLRFPYLVNIQGYLQAPSINDPLAAADDAEKLLADIETSLFSGLDRTRIDTLGGLCDTVEYVADGVDLNELKTNIIRVDVILRVTVVRRIGEP